MNTDKPHAKYKIFVSLAFGLLGFCINFFPLDVVIPPHKASFVWGLIFPMLISLAWGWKYGLLSTTIGLGGQTMWFLWLPVNGWAPFVSIILYNLWIVWHGWCAEKMKKGILRSFYGAEIPFRIFSTIMHLTLFPWVFRFNPSPWAPQMTMTTAPAPFVHFIVFKLLVEGFMVLFLADILLNFSFFQKVLLQEDRKAKTGHLISASLLFGLIFWIISGIAGHLFFKHKVDFLLSHENQTLADSLILHVPPHEFFTRIIFIFTCLLAGLIVAKYVSRYMESEERYRTFFNNKHLIVLILDPLTAQIVDANPGACNFYGFDKKELLSKKIFDLNILEENQILREMEKAKSEKRQHFFFKHRLANGKIRDVEVYSGPISLYGKELLCSLIHDITQRRKAEEELKFTQFAIDRSSDAAFWITQDAKFYYVNNSAVASLGYSREELLGMSLFDIDSYFPQDKWESHWNELKQKKSLQFETKHQAKDGTIFSVEVVANYIEFDDRAYNCAFVRNITERKVAEATLAAEKERLSVTLRSIGDGVITTDTSGKVVLINKIAETLTGWPSVEAIGRPLEEVFHIINEQTRELCENPVEKVLRTGQIVELANHTALITKDGRELSIADSGAPILDYQSEIIGVVLVFRDISEQKKTERELLKIKKLESVGVLAGGIAHDFNNILAAILGNINLALFDESLSSSTKNLLSEAEKASLRAKNLTQQLLTFSKGGEPVKETATLETVIKESANFVLHGDKVACQFNFPKDLWLVDIDKGQIGQVIQNIVINASHAMPEGGTIVISCENISAVDRKSISFRGNRKFVKISIQDSGIGIPSKIIEKIFDPYFSTKKEGSGLGLAICQSIIKNHDGHIFVESSPGEGSIFIIYLPASEKNEPSSLNQGHDINVATHAKILIMDDEEIVQNVARLMLVQLGSDVILASDGVEAIQLYKEAMHSNNPIQLVIMDLTIPGGMGGKDSVQEILKLNPDAKVIVSSGYSNDPIMANYEQYGFCAAIVKPYRLQDLSSVLRKVLNC